MIGESDSQPTNEAKIKEIKRAIKVIDGYISPTKEHQSDRKLFMKALKQYGGDEQEKNIEEICVYKVHGWTKKDVEKQKRNCKTKTGYLNKDETCAIKAGKALTEAAAGMIYKTCQDNINRKFEECRQIYREKFNNKKNEYIACEEKEYLKD